MQLRYYFLLLVLSAIVSCTKSTLPDTQNNNKVSTLLYNMPTSIKNNVFNYFKNKMSAQEFKKLDWENAAYIKIDSVSDLIFIGCNDNKKEVMIYFKQQNKIISNWQKNIDLSWQSATIIKSLNTYNLNHQLLSEVMIRNNGKVELYKKEMPVLSVARDDSRELEEVVVFGYKPDNYSSQQGNFAMLYGGGGGMWFSLPLDLLDHLNNNYGFNFNNDEGGGTSSITFDTVKITAKPKPKDKWEDEKYDIVFPKDTKERDYLTKYPKFVDLVKNLKKWTDEHPCVTKAMKKAIKETQPNNLTDIQIENKINELLSYGFEPEILILDDNEFNTFYEETFKTKLDPNEYMPAFFRKKDKKIRIRSSLVFELNNNQINYIDGLSFYVTLTILHELIHAGTNYFGLIKDHSTKNDRGQAFTSILLNGDDGVKSYIINIAYSTWKEKNCD